MELLASYYQPRAFDAYTFVFDERDAESGYYAMLGMSEDGWIFCQWTHGIYDPDGDNAHLGSWVDMHTLGAAVRDQLQRRLISDGLPYDQASTGKAGEP